MGKEWDGTGVWLSKSFWQEVYRVLKPGGHMLVWSIPKTSHYTGTVLELAGFTHKDLILHVFGSGFPKSLNVSAAIDKALGATREVVGTRRGKGGQNLNTLSRSEGEDDPDAKGCGAYGTGAVQTDIDIPVTTPASDEAKKWAGWGTALKPAVEIWHLVRKPLSESTVAAQVLKTGTGAINVDATRVKHASPEDLAKHQAGVTALKEKGGTMKDSWKNSSDLSGANDVKQEGRWPAQLLLSHVTGCKKIGTKTVQAPTINRFTDGMKPFGDGAGHPYESSGGGTEEQDVWECTEGCTVRAMDAQSGETKSAMGRPGVQKENDSVVNFNGKAISTPGVNQHGDSGGASRFFQTFEPEVPFFYTAKASKSEKEDGLQEFDKATRGNTHPCLHPDALVMTEKGYRPIKDIRVGDPVLAADGSFHDVEAVTRHPYTSEALVEIRVMGTSFTSRVSDNHPYLIWRPTRERNAIVGGEVLWLRAEQVTKGDYTMTPIVQRGRPEWEPPRPEDTDFWFIVGLYLAEGCPHSTKNEENYYPSFSLHEDETALIERIKMYVAPTNIGVYPKKNHDGVLSKGVQVVAFDLELGGLCVRLCGRGAATKSIDPSVWNLPEESLCAFVEGYFAGDGGVVRTYLQAKSVSQDLASQMRFLGEMLGYKVELQCVPAEPGHIGEREFKSTSPVHVLRMMDRNRTISHRKPSRPTVLEHEGIVFTLAYVKEVQRVPYVGDVLNLSVEGSHTFQTAVGVSHNTVKPIALMRYLVKMITPKGGIVLDPFAGSGSTLVAALEEGDNFIGIEREDEYIKIARKRIDKPASTQAAKDIFDLMMSGDLNGDEK